MYRIDFSRLRFLIIDDNVHMRRLLRTILHGFGTREIIEAEDGAVGLEVFSNHLPDIVLADWSMPVLNGVEFTRMIRYESNSRNPFVPVIMVTAYSEIHRVAEARDAGVTEFLVKPISAKALYQRILAVIVSPRPFIRTTTYFGPDRRRTTNAGYQGPNRRVEQHLQPAGTPDREAAAS